MRKRPRRKVTRPTKARLEAERLDWVVRERILFRVTHCHRCGAEPGPLHAPTHRAWLEEVLALGALYRIPSKEVSS